MRAQKALVAIALSLSLIGCAKPSVSSDQITGPLPVIKHTTSPIKAIDGGAIHRDKKKKPPAPLGRPGTRVVVVPPPLRKYATHYTSVIKAFVAKGLVQWWNFPTQVWGANGEKGTDYNMGAEGVPVGAIAPGTVVYVGNGGYPGSSLGEIIQIQASDGSLTHYQHMMTSNVSVGQKISVGDVIGKGGGCPVGAYAGGSACTWYDQWTTGQHIEVRYSPTYVPALGIWSQAWIDPRPIFWSMSHR